ncbi:MAG: ATPase [Lachnospiraceae bacterium]|nr:ATPase [Lachnospiraceae bacterium]
MFYERMLAERNRLDSEIQELQTQLRQFPKGKLFCTKNRQYFKWYITDGKTQTYLPKKMRPLAEKLATKKYLSLLVEDLIHEKMAIEFYLRHHSSLRHSREMLLDCLEYKTLISPYFTPKSEVLQNWSQQPFQANPKYPEQLIHKASSGKMVRSKSEVIIDMFLYTNKIPYHYEAPLQLDHITLYPDFTIRHPETGQFFYWEHFGLVDQAEYQKNMISKLDLYTSHGILPGIQLITTFETKEYPLSMDLVKKIVDYYFL